MAKPRSAPAALDALRDAAIDALDRALEDPPEDPPQARKPKAIDPQVAVLFPSGVVQVHELLASANAAWREATMREAPSLEKLSGTVKKVNADAASGYVSVSVEGETFWAFVPREQLATIVALLVRRPIDAVARELGSGPVSLTP